jgi:hypothetical protein
MQVGSAELTTTGVISWRTASGELQLMADFPAMHDRSFLHLYQSSIQVTELYQ